MRGPNRQENRSSRQNRVTWRAAQATLAVLAVLLVACGGAADPTDADPSGDATESSAATQVADQDEADQGDGDLSDDEATSEEPSNAEVAANEGPPEAEAADEAGGDAGGSGPSAGSSSTGGATAVSGELELHFIDVGQADATLLLHDEVAILIDTGGWQGSQVVPYLRGVGVTTLDLVIITHPHADHIGQFDQVMDAFDVAEVWWSGSTTTTQTFGRALTALERSDAAYEEPRAGASTSIGPLAIEVVNPPAGVGLRDLHDANLAMRITYGGISALFTGDAERATEARMLASSSASLSADILQVGHHGSNTSTTPNFLAAVDPAVAVYSAGSGNSYGHPHAEVLDRLHAAGVELYGTDVNGTVVISTDGSTWSVTTGRSGTPAGGSGGSAGSGSSGSGSSGSASSGSGSSGSASSGSGSSGSGSSSSGSSGSTAEQPATGSGGAGSSCGPGTVDINTAGYEQLQDIIHIGPDRADQIIALRPFTSVRALERVSGIAAGRLADIEAEGIACAS